MLLLIVSVNSKISLCCRGWLAIHQIHFPFFLGTELDFISLSILQLVSGPWLHSDQWNVSGSVTNHFQACLLKTSRAKSFVFFLDQWRALSFLLKEVQHPEERMVASESQWIGELWLRNLGAFVWIQLCFYWVGPLCILGFVCLNK
jgi:hypothetical protein